MAATADRSITTIYSGDVTGSKTHSAAQVTDSLAEPQIVDLASGDNTITFPVSSGKTLAGVTIVPPSGNAQTLKLKGVAGDTGVTLHKTDPTSLGIGGGSSFVLNAGGAINGVRLFWT